jgi:hypothetical protein
MKSRTTRLFRQRYRRLPVEVRRQARRGHPLLALLVLLPAIAGIFLG